MHKSTPITYGIIAALLGVLFYPALVWLLRTWLSNPYYSHGFLVPPIAALLAWRRWRTLRAEPRQGSTWVGIPVILASMATAIWSFYWQNFSVAAIAFVALLAGILLFLEGWPRLKHWRFPILFLTFMVPLPFIDTLSPRLESFTAEAATSLARLVGVLAVHQGGEIALPNTTLVVGAPCSGLRSLVAMFTVAAVWLYVVQGRTAAKAAMLAAVFPLVTLSNVLRISLLLAVAVTFGEQVALSYYHDWSSPFLFLLALGLLLMIGKLLQCSQLREDIF